MKDLVSVVITTHKRSPELVSRAIKSVLNQTYSPIEIIVVDDSPESFEYRKDVENMCCFLSNNIKYLKQSVNTGACIARNNGAKISKGEYIAFLDDDDEWLPEKIEKQIRMIKTEDYSLVYCGSRVVNDTTGAISVRKTKYISGHVFDELIYENFIGSTSFPLIKKESFDKVTGFDPQMESAQDYDLWLRLAKEYKISCVQEPLVDYHIINGERISTHSQKRINGQLRLIEKNKEYLNKNKRALWYRKLRLILNYSNNKQFFKAITVWLSAVLLCPFKIFINFKYFCLVVIYYGRAIRKR